MLHNGMCQPICNVCGVECDRPQEGLKSWLMRSALVRKTTKFLENVLNLVVKFIQVNYAIRNSVPDRVNYYLYV